METFSIVNPETGVLTAFEIENVYAGPWSIAGVLEQVEGVSNVRVRRLFTRWEEIHVWFSFYDQPCVVWEPFGDSSRYWIGFDDSVKTPRDMSPVERAFRLYRPPLFRRIVGDLICLKPIKVAFRKSGRE